MAGSALIQAEADALLAMDKRRTDDAVCRFPDRGGSLVLPLISTDRREHFSLDLRRGRIRIDKATYQNRARSVVILARLDLGGPPHRNPDGAEIGSPHLHRYREGYGDKWAFPLPADFSDPSDAWTTLQDFMRFCHIVEPPKIQRGVFP